MSEIADKIMKDQMIREITSNMTQEEKEEFSSWMKEYIEPLDSMISSLRDLISTEKSSELLADAINGIFTEEGVEEVKKCLQERS